VVEGTMEVARLIDSLPEAGVIIQWAAILYGIILLVELANASFRFVKGLLTKRGVDKNERK
tara:strand:+ start:952 stop:1134 length:183 start_codon:yes stop_codon:yes gene_type:complete